MILRELRAEGFMRFELLELGELPRGVIGLVGENEAGKTTIGEAVAFALFGRTIRTEGTDPTQAIHWEKDECRTRIAVELPGRGVHRVERLVARTGEFEARLIGPDGAVLAEGPRRVGEALHRLLGFDFSTFRYSFYVAQHELDLIQREGRDNARRIVYDMLGITTVERARGHLEEEHEHQKERLTTLERDLLVAQALHGEMLPVRDELAQLEQQLTHARERHTAATAEEQRARTRRDQAERAVEAERDRAAALQRVEAALVASSERQSLLTALRRLEGLAEQGTTHVRKVEATSREADDKRKTARDGLEQAQAIDRAAQALSALVVARRDQLSGEVAAETGPDSLPARRAREEAAAVQEARAARWLTIGGALALLLAVAATGVALALRLPGDAPSLTFAPRELHSPRLELRWSLTPASLTPPLGGAAAVLALLGAWALYLRAGHARRAQAAQGELARLGDVDAQGRRELDACRVTQVLGPLEPIEKGLEPVTAQNVKDGLTALKRAAGAHMSGRASPAELLSEAQARLTKAEAAARDADGALAEARRVETFARHALEEVRDTIRVAFPEGVPQAAPGAWGEAPASAQALEAEAQRVLGLAVRARIELEALESGKRAAPVGESVQALKAALAKGFEAHPGDADAARARYEEQSGLPELLRARPEPPNVEDLRAVVRRERELLDELLGDAGTLRTGLQAAEGAARRAREELVQAQVGLDDARARSERLGQQRRRLDELETKVRELTEVVAPGRRELLVQREAIALLDELATNLKARFGPAIARYIELVLPRLTNGRYRRARIEPDLDIRIFSPERGDFVRLLDLSLGTADQVLLSLRLGLARALIASRGIAGGHFLFLDEPLVSADAAREHAFLELLRTFDDEFAQIFVTSPRSMEEGPFVRTIELTREARVQRLSAAGAGA